jgi:hypothetical protein
MSILNQIERGKGVLAGLQKVAGQIADGYTNLFLENLNLLPPEVQAIYAFRFGECLRCPMRVGNACSKNQRHQRVGSDCTVRGCGCRLAAATKSPSKHCVMHKWPPIHPETLEPLPYPPDKSNNICR